jgi:molybdopterin-guanine dinucleotide biosynthesis protein A
MDVMRAPVAAAILAGGQARRMGGVNKAGLRIGAERMLDRQLRLLRLVADPVFIVSSRRDIEAGDVERVPDAVDGAGPLGGIYTALRHSPRTRTLVVGCDLPFLTRPLLDRLTAPSAAQVVIPHTAGGFEPLCATWAAGCADVIYRRIQAGELKAALALDELRVEEVGPEFLATCDPHGLLFVNVNTPHDHERARRLSREESKSLRDRIMDVSEDS